MQKKWTWKRVLKVTAGTLLSLLLVVVIAFYALFHNELATLFSLKKVDDHTLYTMTYQGDYGFDDFLKQGAGSDSELVSFVTQRLLKGIPLEFSIPDLGCSTYNAVNADGDKIFGRNFDLTYAPALFVKTKPDNGYASMSMVNLGFLGFNEEKLPDSFMKQIITLAAPYAPLDGINEKGLSVGVLLIPDEPTAQKSDKIDITTTPAIRLLLDKAANVEEALELLQQYDMHSSAGSCYHFQIADADGNSVVVEYVDNQFSVVEPKEGEHYLYATNFLLSKEKYNFGHGQDRYAVLQKTLDETDGVLADMQADMDLLEAVSQDEHINSKGEVSATQWSVVYNNTDLTADIIVGNQYDKEAHHFSLKEE